MNKAGFLITFICFLQHRESQAFIEKNEGTLGQVKGKKLYTYNVMVMKVSSHDPKCNTNHVYGIVMQKSVHFSTYFELHFDFKWFELFVCFHVL